MADLNETIEEIVNDCWMNGFTTGWVEGYEYAKELYSVDRK